jgi:hypothetical protein
MSKVAKSVGRAVSKVVKGVTNVVKKVASSKLGKVLIAAAAIYFGGAALTGAMQGASAGSGFLGTISSAVEGAATGIGNAWSSLGTAASQAVGGNFANAGNALSTGFQGGTASMVDGAMVSQPLSIASAPITPAAPTVPSTAPTSGLDVNSLIGKAPPQMSVPGLNVPAAPPSGMIEKMMASQYTAPALISGGTQLIGGAMQGYSAQQQQKKQEQMAADERNRYNTNVGTRLWG